MPRVRFAPLAGGSTARTTKTTCARGVDALLDDAEERSDLNSWLRILEKIVAQSANMVVITDAEQRVRWVNQTYTEITG